MKRLFILPFFLLAIVTARAQVFQVDTVIYHGDISKYINVVIMGDGYTSAQQNAFRADADSLSKYLFTQSPWSHYAGYFNVFAIRVISPQSGAKHPNTAGDCSSTSPSVPVSSPNTYLGCSFDAFGIHRLVEPQNVSNVSAVLAANFPAYDQVLIIANSPYYGGSGGAYATSTIHSSSKEVTAHEIGHSFAGLADEYYAGDSYAAEKPNMTQQTSTALVKWKAWLGTNGVGIYPHCCSGNAALWYKPNQQCKMQTLSNPYCTVCSEAIIESIHDLVNPIAKYLPATASVSSPQQMISFKLSELMKPQPNTLHIIWKLDGISMAVNVDSVRVNQATLTSGAHKLTVSVTDTTALLRVVNHATVHVSTVSWTINKSAAGVALTPADGEFSWSVYPNPAGKQLNFSLELYESSPVSIELFTTDGRLIRKITYGQLTAGRHLNTINVDGLAPGAYLISFNVGDYVRTEQWIKQ